MKCSPFDQLLAFSSLNPLGNSITFLGDRPASLIQHRIPLPNDFAAVSKIFSYLTELINDLGTITAHSLARPENLQKTFLALSPAGAATAAMFLLTPEDVEITSIQHPKKDKKVPILSYENKSFRLLSVFNAHQQAEAHASWRDLTENEGKLCVLLEERFRYSIWRQVRIDVGLLRPVAPLAYAKACVVMIQALYSDAEQLLGSRQAKNFGVAIEVNAAKQIEAAGGLGGVLRLDPLADVLPRWEEDDLSALLLELHRLGAKFFGRYQFVGRTLGALDELAPNDKAVFLNWLEISLLGNLWLAS